MTISNATIGIFLKSPPPSWPMSERREQNAILSSSHEKFNKAWILKMRASEE
jgi:hypothetical protein